MAYSSSLSIRELDMDKRSSQIGFAKRLINSLITEVLKELKKQIRNDYTCKF